MKMQAEVDEFGVLCVTRRADGWWAEAACFYPGAVVSVVRIDADNAPLEQILEIITAVHGLREWATNGGKAPWLNVSSPTTS